MDVKPIRKQRKTTGLTPKELAVLRTNSKLSDKEIKLCYEGFLKTCPTGKLDQNRFADLYKQFEPKADAATCVDMFEFMDKNGDGTIDFSEFLFVTAVNNLTGPFEDRLEFIFDFWDVTEDEYLDQNELGHLISAMYDRARVKDRQGDKDPHRRAKEIIAKLDINNDKKLSKEEFIKGCTNDKVIAQLLAPAL